MGQPKAMALPPALAPDALGDDAGFIGFELTCEGELGGTFQNPKDALRN